MRKLAALIALTLLLAGCSSLMGVSMTTNLSSSGSGGQTSLTVPVGATVQAHGAVVHHREDGGCQQWPSGRITCSDQRSHSVSDSATWTSSNPEVATITGKHETANRMQIATHKPGTTKICGTYTPVGGPRLHSCATLNVT